ncbi:hypothetical protein ERC79_08070 [Rhodococcus sp. ABRD24]|uniref:DUF6636 domain-containing protein n=1 Tax=Rhodococcus sp. ABRD24 TaxID=2507582 RepID=UPI00103EB31B|nr:DUF6636 domain-containing protein [Rhodococcus sp. ABRD24]QBJ95932.1 hypothetical protein ERC79_08070 [Rhodococcus sp. ABRD24]
MRRVSLLCLGVGAVLTLTACGGSPDAPAAAESSTTTAAPTTTTPEAPAPTTTQAPVATTTETTTSAAGTSTLTDVQFQRNESYYFTSPDGGFRCGIVKLPSRTEAGCEGVTRPLPPKPDDCMVSWGNGIRVENVGRGGFMCSGGQVYTSGSGADPVLAPGVKLAKLGYTCETTARSVTCTNDGTGHGFTVAPDSNETF